MVQGDGPWMYMFDERVGAPILEVVLSSALRASIAGKQTDQSSK